MQTLIKKKPIYIFLLSTILLLGITVKHAFAEVIERIQINQTEKEAEIRVRFVTRIQFLRQVMLKNGDVRIYFNLLEIDAVDPRLVWQKMDSPPSNIVPRFTVTYPEIDSSLTISFGKAVEYHIRPGNDGRSISFFTPIVKQAGQSQAKAPLPALEVKPPSAVISTPSQAGMSDTTMPAAPRDAAEITATEMEAKQLMDNANNALKNNSAKELIAILQKLLSLPLNQQSQTAQLMLGQAYERNKEFAKARAEYYAYITRYPKAGDYDQVHQSLTRMVMAAYEAEQSVPEKMTTAERMTYFGEFSQQYSKGVLQTVTTTPPSAAAATLTTTDQSQLLSSLALTGLKRTESTETRLVFRDAFTASFTPGIGSNNFLNAAYIEQGPSDQSFLYGMGRQAGAAGGVPTRFDGAWMGSTLSPAWRVNSTFGKPVAAPGSKAETKTFAAISADLTRLPGQWSGNMYFVEQEVAGILDRRAAGVETHYFDSQSNHMGLFEYDTLFKKLNTGLVQGNWTTAEGANYTMLIEHRKNLQTTNALALDQPAQTIKGLLNAGVSANTLRANALEASPIFSQFMLGTTQPFSSHLKFGGDIRVTNTASYQTYDSLINATTIFPRVRSYIYSAQILGNDLLFDNDLGVVSVSYTNASTLKAKSLSFSQVAAFRQNLQLNIALQLYAENSNLSVYLKRISTSFNLSYRAGPSQYLEGGAGFLQTHTSSPVWDDKTRRKYFNLGYRWSF